jgi:hypothetical protein
MKLIERISFAALVLALFITSARLIGGKQQGHREPPSCAQLEL